MHHSKSGSATDPNQSCKPTPLARPIQSSGARVALSEIRREGLIRAAWASGLFAALLALTLWLTSIGFPHTPWEFAIPGGFALSGIIQAVTGVPFARFASRWDGLKPWQRGVSGVAIVLAAAALIFAMAAAYIVTLGAA